MGEYGEYNGEKIKMGTLENMYYLRVEDRGRVRPLPGSLDPATENGLRFRLPFPDEDDAGPGCYGSAFRGYRLYKTETDHLGRGYAVDFNPDGAEKNTGTVQLHHESGLLVGVTCYHGLRLPEGGGDFHSPGWNGKSWAFELAFVKKEADGVWPVVRCRFCSTMWRHEWADVLPYVQDDIKPRLMDYAGGDV